MYTICFLSRDKDGTGCVQKYGPTSESRTILETCDCNRPSGLTTRAVLSLMRGPLLRVSQRSVDAALRRAGV